MKKIVITLIQICLLSGATYSQGILDKAKSKISKEKTTTSEFTSLNEVAKGWEDGNYSSKKRSSGMYEPAGKVSIKFEKDAEGNVINVVIKNDTYKTSASTAKPFVISYGGRYGALYLTSESIVMYSMRNGDIWVEKCYGKKMGIKTAEKEIQAFRDFGEAQRASQESEHFAKAAEEAKVKEAARKKAYGLEGKDVAKIEIINLKVPEKFGHFRGFTFDLKATLKDGTEISTANSSEGYTSDYTISYSAPNYKVESLENKLNSGFLDKDVITITATCKSNPALSASKDVVVKYNEDVSFSYRNGYERNWGNGGNAMNYRFEVKQTKHTETGEALLKIRIINVSEGGALVSEFKMSPDQTFHFSCNGGNGGKYDDPQPGNGGNGGDITLIKDPSVKYFNFDYSNKGGNAGPNYAAVRGRDGSYREEVRQLQF
ncbi:MAG: hypothetical protein Crog4KO_14300 [Crocinitomicaceae bacterium]